MLAFNIGFQYSVFVPMQKRQKTKAPSIGVFLLASSIWHLATYFYRHTQGMQIFSRLKIIANFV
jgi:hypothetical protein